MNRYLKNTILLLLFLGIIDAGIVLDNIFIKVISGFVVGWHLAAYYLGEQKLKERK